MKGMFFEGTDKTSNINNRAEEEFKNSMKNCDYDRAYAIASVFKLDKDMIRKKNSIRVWKMSRRR
ncbi:MAG: hypothetical protein QXT34_00130 [Candidatus Aenigmatarchaeota archaeon]